MPAKYFLDKREIPLHSWCGTLLSIRAVYNIPSRNAIEAAVY